MALQAKEKEQQEHIVEMLQQNGRVGIIEHDENGIYFDDYVTFDQMAEIVDYLRTQAPKKELFEECWKAYNRKGSKKKALDYWKKLSDEEKEDVLPHIRAYVSSRELQYQKDFERYLRDRIFKTVVFANNKVIYDPTKAGKGENHNSVYMPTTDGMLTWNDFYKVFIYAGYYNGAIADGYNDDNRPEGARVMLNNGRGFIRWNAFTKRWEKE